MSNGIRAFILPYLDCMKGQGFDKKKQVNAYALVALAAARPVVLTLISLLSTFWL